ncbi:hypothetical protein Godav_027988 [Gossypium davidsonii]|uniref:RNase H type-1 domain-containing protein n=1 Tax=Gossypium davidsonii TaxID=34287 RepID=A0A7J8RZC1_GOSDV|nr:hypothetical protein [Gossypium davidsonii]
MYFLMKIGFGLVSKSNALWVRVIWSKPLEMGQVFVVGRTLGSQNLDLFHVWLLEVVINKIISIPSPYPDLESDKRLLTNSEHTRRGIGQNNSYAICRHEFEDMAHVLRDCPATKDNISWSTTEVVKVSTSWARQFELYFSGYKSNVSFLNHANISKSTWVLLSTDGSVAKDSGHAATRGMVRDRDGNWIMGFGRYLGVCSLFEAEVWSTLDGILLLLNKGYSWTITQTDSLKVVQALTDMGMEESKITVLRRT